MTPNFSVIITTYDVPELLLECLESFDKFQNIEILVGIDGCENTKNKLVDLERKKNTVNFIPEGMGQEFISEMPIIDDTVPPGFGNPQDIAKGGFIDMTKDKKYFKGRL